MIHDYVPKPKKRILALVETSRTFGCRIAVLLGYQTSEYFIRVFQRHFNMTPKQFRDKARDA